MKSKLEALKTLSLVSLVAIVVGYLVHDYDETMRIREEDKIIQRQLDNEKSIIVDKNAYFEEARRKMRQ